MSQILTTSFNQTVQGWNAKLAGIFSSTLTEEEKLAVLQKELAKQVEAARINYQQSIAAEKSLVNPSNPESMVVLQRKIEEYTKLGKEVLAPKYKKYLETPEVEPEEEKLHEQMQELSVKINTLKQTLTDQEKLQAKYHEISELWAKQYQQLQKKYTNMTQQGAAKLRHFRALQTTNESLAAAKKAAMGIGTSPETTIASLDAAISQEENMYSANLEIEGKNADEFDPDKMIAVHREQSNADANIADWLS
jgi:hypothetical protein